MIDANSGAVHLFPHTICCWGADVDDKFRPIEFRLGSRLIVFLGERNEKEGDDGAHYYDFKDGKFVHVKSDHEEIVIRVYPRSSAANSRCANKKGRVISPAFHTEEERLYLAASKALKWRARSGDRSWRNAFASI